MKSRGRIFDGFTRHLLELSAIAVCFCLFSIAATISPLSDKNNMMNVLLWDFVFLCPMALCAWLQVRLWKKKAQQHFFSELFHSICGRHFLFLSLLLAAVLLRILQLGTLPKWDSETYFMSLNNGCSTFAFSLKSYIISFRMAGHTSLGYALLIAIGAYLTPSRVIGIQIVNLVLFVLWMTALYSILLKLFFDINRNILACGAFLISMEPMFLGTFSGVSLDFGLTVFILLLFWCQLYDKPVLFFFIAGLLAQTKEVGIVMLAGYGLGSLLYTLFCSEGKIIKRFWKALYDPYLVSLLVIALLIGLYYLAVRYSYSLRIWGSGLQANKGKPTVNYFAFNWSYIFLKLKTLFILNFEWILLGIAFLLLLWRQIRHGRCFLPFGSPAAIGFYGSLTALFAFNCLFITYNNPRYLMPIIVGNHLLWIGFVIGNIDHRKKTAILLLLLVALEGGEAYKTLDPLTLKAFTVLDAGNGIKMVHTGWDKMKSLTADIATYNYQIAYLDKAYDKMLEEIEYNGEFPIIIGGDDYSTRASFLKGMRVEQYWDPYLKHRTYKKTSSVVPISILFARNITEAIDEFPEESIVVWTSLFDKDEQVVLNQINPYYEVVFRHEVHIDPLGGIVYFRVRRI